MGRRWSFDELSAARHARAAAPVPPPVVLSPQAAVRRALTTPAGLFVPPGRTAAAVVMAPAQEPELPPAPLDDESLSEAPVIDRIRAKKREINGRTRSATVPSTRLTRDEIHLRSLDLYPEDVDRPRKRADCGNMPRPCPFVSCHHHLYLDVNPQTGALKLNFPHLEVWELAETCSLDVADRGGITLEEVGAIMNLTRERIRQVEVRGLRMVKEAAGDELGMPPDHASA